MQDRYGEVIEKYHRFSLSEKARGRFFACALQSNPDYVLNWDVQRFQELLDRYSLNIYTTPLNQDPPESTESVTELLRSVLQYMLKGEGACIKLKSAATANELMQILTGKEALGGTGAQGAAALASFGFPVLVHLSDRSPDVLRILTEASSETVEGERRIPVSELQEKSQNIIHMILQYNAGDQVCFNGKSCLLPRSNRLIIVADEYHGRIPVHADFFSYCVDHVEDMSSLLLSGLDAISDEAILNQRLEDLSHYCRALKVQKPDLPIYFEAAHYYSEKSFLRTLKKLLPLVDVFGLNEDEFASLNQGVPFELSILPGQLENLRRRLAVPAICFHTQYFSAFALERAADPALEEALMMGQAFSGSKAAFDRYASAEDCRRYARLPLSREGLEQIRSIKTDQKNGHFLAIPAKDIGNPKTTIGLGDCFAAGVQTGLWQSFSQRQTR